MMESEPKRGLAFTRTIFFDKKYQTADFKLVLREKIHSKDRGLKVQPPFWFTLPNINTPALV